MLSRQQQFSIGYSLPPDRPGAGTALEALAQLLIAHEVVDRTALTRLLATGVPEEAPYAPVEAGATRA